MATPAISTTQVFTHDQFGDLRVRYDDNGNVRINLEDAARGLGFADERIVSGKTYTCIRWYRIKQYLEEFGYTGEVNKDTYIPESTFLQLTMKANSKAAKKFQRWIADEVMPNLHKRGGFEPPTASVTPESVLDPDLLIRFATELKELRAKNVELEVKVDIQAKRLKDVSVKNAELTKTVDMQAWQLEDARKRNAELAKTIDAQAQQLKKYEGIVEPLVNLADAIAAFDKPAVVFQSIAQKGAK